MSERDLYRGFWVRSFAEGGVPCVGVREKGKMTWDEKFVGTGDRQVGMDWVDERLDGVKRRDVGAGGKFGELLESVVGDYEERIAQLQIEHEAKLKAALEGVGSSCGAQERMWLGVDASEGEIEGRFKQLAKVLHPDAGGDEAMFKQLVSDKEECLKRARKGRK